MIGRTWQRLKAHRLYTFSGVFAGLLAAGWGAKWAGLPEAVQLAIFGPSSAIVVVVWFWAIWPFLSAVFRGDREAAEAAAHTTGREWVGNTQRRRRRNRPAGRRK